MSLARCEYCLSWFNILVFHELIPHRQSGEIHDSMSVIMLCSFIVCTSRICIGWYWAGGGGWTPKACDLEVFIGR